MLPKIYFVALHRNREEFAIFLTERIPQKMSKIIRIRPCESTSHSP